MHTTTTRVAALAVTLLAAIGAGQDMSDPWPRAEVLEPATLARQIESRTPPTIIAVAFPVLYRSKHILHAIDGGTASKPEGIETLKKTVASLPRDADIVIYCGCCPMVKCPNIRPAYRTLKAMGFTHLRVLDIATNMHEDWYTKNYPSEAGSAALPAPPSSPK